MYTVDQNKLYHTLWELAGRILSKQSGGGLDETVGLKFNDGWLKDEEGYKRGVWDDAQDILLIGTWNEGGIHTLGLTDRVIRCMDIPMDSGAKHNLLDWRETADGGVNSLKIKLGENRELSDRIIYQIFRGNNEERVFRDAVSAWGAKYPFISFLFFLKNKNKFVPVRPMIMKRKLEMFGITTDCLDTCSWENYQEFLKILKKFLKILQEEIDPAAELIDAHSFVWVAWLLAETEVDPLALQFEKLEQELSREGAVGNIREILVKACVNQSLFRERLLLRYKKCELCEVDHPSLLIASHILPWSESDENEKVDGDNGLLLCPNHDRLFDGGWITFSDDGQIIISKRLSEKNRLAANVREDMRITLTGGNRRYMKYHRENIFRDK